MLKLTIFKTDIDAAVCFNSLYDDCFEICESRSIDPLRLVPMQRKRNQNSSIKNEKEKFLKSHDKIIDIYVK